MPREWSDSSDTYNREAEDRASVRAYRAAAMGRLMARQYLSDLAHWFMGPDWATADAYLGPHNQPPVSGEIKVPGGH